MYMSYYVNMYIYIQIQHLSQWREKLVKNPASLPDKVWAPSKPPNLGSRGLCLLENFFIRRNKNLSPLRSQPTNCQLENGDIRISVVKIQVILHELDTLSDARRQTALLKKKTGETMERTDEPRVNELEIKTNWLRKPSQTPGQGPLTTVLTRSPQSQKIHRNGYTEKNNIPNKIIKPSSRG